MTSTNPSPKIKILSDPNEYNFIQQWYDLADDSHFWMQWRLEAFKHQISSSGINTQDTLHGIEVGCGHGVVRAQLNNYTSWTIDGAELDLPSLKRNSDCRGDLFFYDVLEKKEEFKDKYDFLILFDVLEHIDDTRPFIEACLFMLKKGGFFFINVPALQSLYSPYDIAAGHFRRYTKERLSKEFSNLPLKILDIRYWGFSLLPLLLIRKLVLNKNQSHDNIIKKGFKPPHHSINTLLKCLMSIESKILKSPPLGTSVMATSIKK